MENENEFRLSLQTKFAIVIAILLLLFSFIAPLLLTRFSILDLSEYGGIGDTLGGIMNPFIAASGVIATFLAFYMQVRANQLQRKLFNEQIKNERQIFQDELKHQQIQSNMIAFEQRFYEMLRLHKENVNELSISLLPAHGHSKEIYGRKVFQKLLNEVECIYAIVKNYFPNHDKDFWIDLSYRYFFLGIGEQDIEYSKRISKNPHDKCLKAIIQINKMNQFAPNVSKEIKGIDFHTGQTIKKYPNFLLGHGHSSQLGHYYRHLFHSVKYVAKQSEEFLSYQNKRGFLRILRAQLSNEEQALLFYNSKSSLGDNWENSTNKFLTDYRMIHNLYNNLLIVDFDLFDEFNLDKYPKLKTESERIDDPIFEFQDKPL